MAMRVHNSMEEVADTLLRDKAFNNLSSDARRDVRAALIDGGTNMAIVGAWQFEESNRENGTLEAVDSVMALHGTARTQVVAAIK